MVEVGDFLLTLVIFVCTVSLVPLLGLSYLFVTIVHSLWLTSISFFYPELEFIKQTTFRTLVETHRNQGIVTLLLSIRGPPEVEAIRRHLHELVHRKDKYGNLTFPRLRQGLVTKCGVYAWQKYPLDLEQNIILGPNNYKGRTINELNIQDFVSEIVMKYLPAGVPPWQIVIVPTSENQHYLLLKLHHVLLNEGLNIADLLPLIPPVRTNMNVFHTSSPLTNVFKEPVNIPYLLERLTEEFTNRWNEFIFNYDPLERPELLKSTPGFFQFIAISIITAATILKECRKGFTVIKSDPISKIGYLYSTVLKETERRRVTFSNWVLSIFVTVNPKNLIAFLIKYWWHIIITVTFRLPHQIYHEFMALFSCIIVRYCAYPNTIIGNIYNYVPLFFYAIKEALCFLRLLFYTPRIILAELTTDHETIDTMTLCGRKVIAWSPPVKTEILKKIAKVTRVSETEITFAVVSAAFSRYFSQTNSSVPKVIPVVSRNINSNYIFLTGNRIKPEDSIDGMLCIHLPILHSDKDGTILENLNDIKKNVQVARETQPVTYLLSIFQTKYGIFSKLLPATFIGIVLKYLSKKYAVSLTEVTSRQPNVTQKTIWGKEVTSVIYWRPPQANICISLCINQYADHTTLGVMCDAQLIPHHSVLARGFSEHVDDLAASTGVK